MSTCLRCIPGVTLRNWHDPYRRNMELTPHWVTGGKSQSPVRSALMNWSRVITTDKYWSQKAKRLDLARASLLNSPTRVIREFGPSLTGCQLSWGPPSVSWHFWMSSSTSSFEASWKQDFFSFQPTDKCPPQKTKQCRETELVGTYSTVIRLSSHRCIYGVSSI